MPFTIIRNNITKMSVDAIVNTANPYPVIGNGTDKAIHKAAGPQLLAARKQIGAIAMGQAAVTPAYNLDADFVIHTVGPVWIDGKHDEEKLLAGCYRNSLKLAIQNKCESIAFPLISSGTYGFPKDKALQIATSVISDFVLKYDITVFLVVFDKVSHSLSEKLFNKVRSYIDENYVEEQLDFEYHNDLRRAQRIQKSIEFQKSADFYRESSVRSSISSYEIDEMRAAPMMVEEVDLAPVPKKTKSIKNIFDDIDESFSESLLRLIKEKGMTNPQAYNKALIDKKHFSKIKNDKYYKPTKYTALAFAIALELNIKETSSLLEKAGLALSRSSKFDLAVRFFIENNIYDIFEINNFLYDNDLPLLGLQ